MQPVDVLASQLKPGRGWTEHLGNEFSQPYMQQLADFLAAEEQDGKTLVLIGGDTCKALPRDRVAQTQTILTEIAQGDVIANARQGLDACL